MKNKENWKMKSKTQYVIYLLSTKSKVCYEEGLNKEEALKTFLYYNPCYIDKVDITTKYGYRKLRHKEKIKLTN